MAANQAALRNYLDATLQLPVTVREAIIAQGMSSFDDFIGLTDKDMKDVCSNAKKPGGTIPNPNWVAGGNMPPTITNPGAPVGFIHEKRLRQLRFHRNYFSIVQRPMVPGQATLLRLRDSWSLYEAIKNYQDGTAPPLPGKLSKQDDARKVIEDLDHYLKKIRNSQGVPMSYLTRDDETPPAVGDDPGYSTPSFDDEMIRRASHNSSDYAEDNKTLWDVVRHITHGGPGWNWVSTHQRSMNGRQAYLNFKGHYMGDGFTNEIKHQADAILEKTYFDGKKRSFTFENYAERVTKAFDDLTEAGEEIGDSRKVKLFRFVILHYSI